MKKKSFLALIIIIVCASLGLVISLCNCKARPNQPSQPSDVVFPEDDNQPQIIISEKVAEIEVGDEYVLTAILNNINGEIQWESSDKTVAVVSDGIVTALREGKATVTAKCGSVSSKCDINVVRTTIAPVIKTNFEEIAIEKGGSVVVKAEVCRKNKTVDCIVNWVLSGDSPSAFTTLVKGNELTLTANESGKTAVITITAQLNGIKSGKAINVSSLADGEAESAAYVKDSINDLPDEFSSMTVSQMLAFTDLYKNYQSLSEDEKAIIPDASKEKLNSLNNSLGGADWKITVCDKLLVNYNTSDELLNGMTVYTINNVSQNQKSAIDFDLSVYPEVYFALKVSGGKLNPSFCGDGTFTLSQDEWYYIKVISGADGSILAISDRIDGEYTIVPTTKYVNNSSIPQNIEDLISLSNTVSSEKISWTIAITGLYTNSATNVLKALVDSLPQNITINDWDNIYKAYTIAQTLSEEELARVEAQISKVTPLYNKWKNFFDNEIANWGVVMIDNILNDCVPDVKLGSIPTYKHSGITKNAEEICKGAIINYNEKVNEYYFALKATTPVKFNETRTPTINANEWYIVKVAKNHEAYYGGWNVYVGTFEQEEFTYVDFWGQWKVGNHEVYNGKAYLSAFIMFDSVYDTPFDIYLSDMFALEPTYDNPFEGMIKVVDSALQTTDSVVGQVGGNDYYKLSGLSTNNTSDKFRVGCVYEMGSYREYRFALKATKDVIVAAATGKNRIVAYKWYIVKVENLSTAAENGAKWRLSVKLIDEDDSAFRELIGIDGWKVKEDIARLDKILDRWYIFYNDAFHNDERFDIYASGLFAIGEIVKPEVSPFDGMTKVADSALCNATLVEEKVKGLDVYSIKGLTPNLTNTAGAAYQYKVGVEYNMGASSEYRFALKASKTVLVAAGEGENSISANTWYIVRVAKTGNTEGAKWSVSVKTIDQSDEFFRELNFGNTHGWKLKNDTAGLHTLLENWFIWHDNAHHNDEEFDLYATSLWAK